jgi:hypothetical protein
LEISNRQLADGSVCREFSVSDLAAQWLRATPPSLPSRTGPAPTREQLSSAATADSIAPFRSEPKADHAMALTGQSLKSATAGQAEINLAAQDAVKNALNIAPHESRMWLALAMLQAQRSPIDPLISESLKMSY